MDPSGIRGAPGSAAWWSRPSLWSEADTPALLSDLVGHFRSPVGPLWASASSSGQQWQCCLPRRTAVKKKCKAERGERGGLWTRQALLGDSVSPPSPTCSPAQPLLWAAFLAVAPEGSSWHHALRYPSDPHPQGTSPQLRWVGSVDHPRLPASCCRGHVTHLVCTWTQIPTRVCDSAPAVRAFALGRGPREVGRRTQVLL